MIEAMACGTPVIAFRSGSVPEVIDHGATGFIVESIDEAVAAASRIETLNRGAIRAIFERRFAAKRMVDDYLTVYRQLRASHAAKVPRPLHVAQRANFAPRALELGSGAI
jgi:glycosyltransferase involved in cell wall biosynthesis